MKKLYRVLVTLGATGAALATFTATPANAAGGGGCNGATVRACISVVSSGNVVADGYLNSIPSGCHHVSVALVDRNLSTIRSTSVSCHTGWLGSQSEWYSSGQTYYSRVRVWNSGGGVIAENISPAQW
ncbi:hypothetical protein AB0395_11580 [Streptosporangium sp. NPDC051023]|uniref:hypothetical protein n=1 Tax=Streptosporangium sp. NPDC051023 TaxID=3155410 RepID=UPI00344F15C7